MRRRLVVLLVVLGATALLVPATSLGAKKGGVQKATVNMSEFRFAGSKLKSANLGEASRLKPGRTQFTFRNRGAFPHNFKIFYKSAGANKFGSRTLDAGMNQRKTINLKAGSYVAVCTVFNGFHASQGMVIEFTVGTKNPNNGNWR